MDDGKSRDITFEAPLTPIAVIQTTFEILGEFPGDAVLEQDMANQMRRARKGLVATLTSLRDGVREGSLLEHTDLEDVKQWALSAEQRGWDGLRIDRLMKTNAFEDALVFDEPLFSVDRYRDLPPRAFAAMLIEEVRAAADTDSSYIDASVFNRAVNRRYSTFLFLCYSATDPEFYQRA